MQGSASVPKVSAAKKNRCRSYRRKPFRCQAQWSNFFGSHWGEIRDISVAGLFLQPATDHKCSVRPGTWVRVKLSHESCDDVNLSGEVKWVGVSHAHQCEGFGIEFDRINPDLMKLPTA